MFSELWFDLPSLLISVSRFYRSCKSSSRRVKMSRSETSFEPYDEEYTGDSCAQMERHWTQLTEAGNLDQKMFAKILTAGGDDGPGTDPYCLGVRWMSRNLELLKKHVLSFAAYLNFALGLNHPSVNSGMNSLLCYKSILKLIEPCLLYTSPSPRDQRGSRMPSSA